MKPLNEHHIEELIADKLSGQISYEDNVLLDRLIATDIAVRKQWEQSLAVVSVYKVSRQADKINETKAWEQLLQKLPNTDKAIKLKRYRYKWIAAAALLLPLLVASLWFGLYKNKQVPVQEYIDPTLVNIKLDDGTVYTLNGKNEIVTGDIRFRAQAADRIEKGVKRRSNEMITLSIPKGKTYSIILEDGTSIKINSATVLKFPLFFEGATREVYLKGEAYFEVAKQKTRPFIVRTSDMNVKVLGTKFNVNTYTGNAQQTSLVEGSVAITDRASKQELLIRPGQAAIKKGRGSSINIQPFSSEHTLSWLKGIYYFNNMPLREIVNITNRAMGEELSIADPKIANYRFSGALETNKPIEILLENIKSAHFTIRYNIKKDKIELY